MKCLGAGNPDKWPEPPEAALELISGGAEWLPYDPEALLREREIRPRSLVAGRDVYDLASDPRAAVGPPWGQD